MTEITLRRLSDHAAERGCGVPAFSFNEMEQAPGVMHAARSTEAPVVLQSSHGVRKVDIDTDCRMAMTGQFRKVAREKKAEFDPRKFLKPAMGALEELCARRFQEFGAAGQAELITVVPMADIAWRYATGSLDPVLGRAKAA